MSEEKQEVKLELINPSPDKHILVNEDVRRGAWLQLQADSLVVSQLQVEITTLTNKGESLCQQNGELLMREYDLKAELAKKEQEIVELKAHLTTEESKNLISDRDREISNLRQEHKKQIREIFKQIERDFTFEKFEDTYAKWKALKSKYQQPKE